MRFVAHIIRSNNQVSTPQKENAHRPSLQSSALLLYQESQNYDPRTKSCLRSFHPVCTAILQNTVRGPNPAREYIMYKQ